MALESELRESFLAYQLCKCLDGKEDWNLENNILTFQFVPWESKGRSKERC